jgi:PAS domain S-box-containing protein
LERARVDEGQDAAHTRRLAALVRDSPDLVGVLAVDGSVEYLSPGFVRLFTGAARTTVDADEIQRLAHPNDFAPLAKCFATAVERPDVPITVRVRCRHLDGGWHLLEGTLTNSLADPDIRGIVLRASDVTERAAMESALRASERHHRRVVEALSEGIVLIDGHGAMVACNGAAERMIGVTADDFLDQPVARAGLPVLKPDGTPCDLEDRPVVHTLRTGEACRRA